MKRKDIGHFFWGLLFEPIPGTKIPLIAFILWAFISLGIHTGVRGFYKVKSKGAEKKTAVINQMTDQVRRQQSADQDSINLRVADVLRVYEDTIQKQVYQEAIRLGQTMKFNDRESQCIKNHANRFNFRMTDDMLGNGEWLYALYQYLHRPELYESFDFKLSCLESRIMGPVWDENGNLKYIKQTVQRLLHFEDDLRSNVHNKSIQPMLDSLNVRHNRQDQELVRAVTEIKNKNNFWFAFKDVKIRN